MQKSKLVALRKESVDRNLAWCLDCPSANMVALRKESVDRNWKQQGRRWWKFKSLSARRAWIEIPCARFKPIVKSVALRKESVDRNPSIAAAPSISALSLSARRAWIEIG